MVTSVPYSGRLITPAKLFVDDSPWQSSSRQRALCRELFSERRANTTLSAAPRPSAKKEKITGRRHVGDGSFAMCPDGWHVRVFAESAQNAHIKPRFYRVFLGAHDKDVMSVCSFKRSVQVRGMWISLITKSFVYVLSRFRSLPKCNVYARFKRPAHVEGCANLFAKSFVYALSRFRSWPSAMCYAVSRLMAKMTFAV